MAPTHSLGKLQQVVPVAFVVLALGHNTIFSSLNVRGTDLAVFIHLCGGQWLRPGVSLFIYQSRVSSLNLRAHPAHLISQGSAGIIDSCLAFMWVLGPQLWASGLCDKCFIH